MSATTAPGVVVVGRGPLAAAVVRRLTDHPAAPGPVEALEELPASGADDVVAGARAVVLVADEADLTLSVPGRAQDRRDAAVGLAQRVVEAARAAGVAQVVAVTSAMVHGAVPGARVVADEAVPPSTPPEGLVGDLVAVEAVLARAAALPGGPAVAVVRPAALVGPGVDTLVTRHFAVPRLLVVRGVEKLWQLVHVDDVASAVALVVEQGWSGGVAVAAEPVLGAREVEHLAGMRPIELGAERAFGTAERLRTVGVLPVPASELAFTVYPWTVDPARLRAAGWRAEHDAVECLQVLLDGVRGRVALAGRQVGLREVALGAAGAAVALLGTAAAWRRASRA